MNIIWETEADGTTTEFKGVPGIDNVFVSRDGEFLIRKHGKRRRTFGARRSSGYLGITRNKTTIYAHRAVYESWIGELPDGFEIDHIDCDRTNNTVENLRAVTRAENMANPITKARNASQLATVRHKARASRVRRVLGIYDSGRIVEFRSVTEACEATGANRSDIARVVRGERKHAGGLMWRYCK